MRHDPSAILDTPGFRRTELGVGVARRGARVDGCRRHRRHGSCHDRAPWRPSRRRHRRPRPPTSPAAPTARARDRRNLTGEPMTQALRHRPPNEKVTITSPFGEAATPRRPARRVERDPASAGSVRAARPSRSSSRLTTSGTTFEFDRAFPARCRPRRRPTHDHSRHPRRRPSSRSSNAGTEEPKPETPTRAGAGGEFTADLGSADLAASPMKQCFYGTGTPGSTVRAESAYGSVGGRRRIEGQLGGQAQDLRRARSAPPSGCG